MVPILSSIYKRVVLCNITIAQLLTKPNFPTAITQIFHVISSNNNASLLGLALLGGIGPVQIGTLNSCVRSYWSS
jgi:hypothetical protein